ncbi:MAG TPA: 3-oxoacyl-ACP reductase FabG [Steroidobacteraceae bacterium]|jgi:3-oxoacyl-[acyl-carrier protein] reductase|nr:3-oxoacyl-ACP reductase FabG [Steroidobacteraceae bacterium]
MNIAASATMRRALVTGGSGGVGAAICRQLVQAGHFVYVHAYRARAQAEALAQEIRAAGGQAEALCFDVTDESATHGAVEHALKAGPVQILVNNAGIHDDAVFPGMTALQWQRVIAVSLQGFFHVTQPLMLPMLRTRWGRIVNVSSVAAQIGNRGQVNYASGKGALISATRALALEVATRGITVNAIAPGIIATRMSADSFDETAIARLVPMRRAGSPDEVASLVSFLTGEGAGYITGQVVSINGGMY